MRIAPATLALDAASRAADDGMIRWVIHAAAAYQSAHTRHQEQRGCEQRLQYRADVVALPVGFFLTGVNKNAR
ncbi:hypothetical protein [Xanthomonas arboricola]|uniref:hypothetical protein n=1 Tax=Xanthomonas arboricola TaxID=56448 RepID=UPI0015E07739|nr:hypothetical protein [Xanthomonas arboricola]